MRVATYNVQGRLWQHGPGRRASRVLVEMDADVIALQEVHPPDLLPDTWELPALGTKGAEHYHVAYGSTLEKHRGPFGNAILSRLPIASVRRIDISRHGREPRGALDVTVAHPAGDVRVIATHLGLRAQERARQIERLLSALGDFEHGLVVLLGDLNEWRRAGTLQPLQAHFGATPWVKSFPAVMPLFALDRVFTEPREALLGIEAHRSALTTFASDHVPVVATIAPAVRLP